MRPLGWDKIKNATAGWKAPLFVTAVLILVVIAGSFLLTESVSRSEEEQSFERLKEETSSLAEDVHDQMVDNCDQLEIIASLIARTDDLTSPEIRQTLASYSDIGTIDHLELLLPDNSFVTAHGDQVDASEQMSFAEVSVQGAHISSRETDVVAPDEYVVRNWVPVMRDGETVAMLCGVIVLGTMPDALAERPYGGNAAIYLIEASTGDFLVDTWHPGQTGNIWQLGTREMAPGYDSAQLQQDLTEGRSGYVVFKSASIGEQLYFCFQPCGVNDWQLALSVPESVVFSRVDAIRGTLNIFLVFETVCLVAYFFWVLHYVRRETGVKQRQLDTINYIYEIEKLLFGAHESRESLATALERISQMTSAEHVCLCLVEDGRPSAFFARDRKGFHTFDPDDLLSGDSSSRGVSPSALSDEQKAAARLASLFESGCRTVEALDQGELAQLLPSGMAVRTQSLAAVPVEESDGALAGILVVRNARNVADELSLLQNVEPSFAMFCRNLRTYRTIKERGEVDAMTGMLNRNRFEADLPRWASRCEKSLACVYVDANGLHELNNEQGHQAGDSMLRAVARAIRETFGREGAYRIGGDEFVAIVSDVSSEEAEQHVRGLEAFLAEEGISVSTGMARQSVPVDIERLIGDAEGLMYQAKRAYYEQADHDRRRRRDA